MSAPKEKLPTAQDIQDRLQSFYCTFYVELQASDIGEQWHDIRDDWNELNRKMQLWLDREGL